MKVIEKKTVIENIEVTIEVEPEDAGKKFLIKPIHIPYSMGCGSNVDVQISEIKS